jgi:hypothetical protein
VEGDALADADAIDPADAAGPATEPAGSASTPNRTVWGLRGSSLADVT